MTKLRPHHISIIAMNVTITLAIIFACVGLYFLGKHVDSTLTNIDTVATNVSTVATSVNSTFVEINKPRTGTLAGLNQDIFEAKGVLDQSNKILNHEDKQLSTLDRQEAQLFNDVHDLITTSNGTVQHLGSTLDAITGTSNQLTADLKSTNDTLQKFPSIVDSSNKLIKDADIQINDPAIHTTLTATADTTQQIDGITTSLNKMGQHFEKQIDDPHKSIWSKLKVAWDIAWQAATIIK